VLIEEDAGVLRSTEEVHGARRIVEGGTSADRQRAVRAREAAAGADPNAAMRGVVRHLIDEFHEDL
jgi:glutamate---cysteine ligase / carboxylate-amine ligase